MKRRILCKFRMTIVFLIISGRGVQCPGFTNVEVVAALMPSHLGRKAASGFEGGECVSSSLPMVKLGSAHSRRKANLDFLAPAAAFNWDA